MNEEMKSDKNKRPKSVAGATMVTHGGPGPAEQFGMLNPPVYRASTVFYSTVDAYKRRHDG